MLDNERYCVQLTSLLKKNIADAYAVFADEVCPQGLYGVLNIKKTILHCLPFAKSGSETALQEDFFVSFCEFYKKNNFNNPVCINGTADGTQLMEKCFESLGQLPDQQNEYSLLLLDERNFLQQLRKQKQNKEIKIFRCKKDISEPLKSQLLIMQEEYEKEEIVPACFTFDEDSCRLRFLTALRTQFIFALQNSESTLISKAGTNAIGYKFVQLGGVFTKKEDRGKGFAGILLNTLLFKLLKMRKKIVLFVKKQNLPANKLYASLGFKNISDYTILYYRKL